MGVQSMKHPREALMASVPQDSVSWILYRSGKYLACLKAMRACKTPEDWKKVADQYPRLFNRVFKTFDRINAQKAKLFMRSPVELELVEKTETGYRVTWRGEQELARAQKQGIKLDAEKLIQCAEKRVLLQAKLQFERKPDFGRRLWESYMKGKTDQAKISQVLNLLYSRVNMSELCEDIDVLREWEAKNYPIRDRLKVTFLEGYEALQNLSWKAPAVDEFDSDSDYELETDGETDTVSVRDPEFIGPNSVSQDPQAKLWGFIGILKQAQVDKLAGEELWQVIRPIVDHYTAPDFSVEHVYLGPRSDEARMEREDFPYDPVVVEEPVLKVKEMPPKLVDIRPDEREAYMLAGVIKPGQHKLLLPGILHTEPVCSKTGRPLVNRFLLETDGDFELERDFEQADEQRDWRKRLLQLLTPPNASRLPHTNASTIEKMEMLRYKARFFAKYPDKDEDSFEWFLSKGLLDRPAPALV